jgi:hypothetical protein
MFAMCRNRTRDLLRSKRAFPLQRYIDRQNTFCVHLNPFDIYASSVKKCLVLVSENLKSSDKDTSNINKFPCNCTDLRNRIIYNQCPVCINIYTNQAKMSHHYYRTQQLGSYLLQAFI